MLHVYKVTQPQYAKAEIPKLNKALCIWNVSAKVRKVAGTIKKLCLSWSRRETTENVWEEERYVEDAD